MNSIQKMLLDSRVRIISKGYNGLKGFMEEMECELDLEGITSLVKGKACTMPEDQKADLFSWSILHIINHKDDWKVAKCSRL